MIESTFQIVPGVGATKERYIWSLGVKRWDSFLDCDTVGRIAGTTKQRYDSIIGEASDMLRNGDSRGIGEMLKPGDRWRLFGKFRKGAAYLDIETDGLDRDSLVTVLTIHRDGKTTTLTHDIDLDAESLSNAIGDAAMIVSFNGTCFDVPVLRNSFPGVDFDMPHFDLRFGFKKIGQSGGLKIIEKRLGISRDDDIADVDGFEAVRLWKRWERHGDKSALDTLAEYNRADVENLVPLAEIAYNGLVKSCVGFE